MVSIVPADDVLYRKLDRNPQSLCLTAYESDRLIGYIFYTLEKDFVMIDDMEFNDAAIADGLIRAALNSAAQSGFGIAVCRKKSLFSVMIKTGFHLDEKSVPEEMRIEIDEMYGKCCK